MSSDFNIRVYLMLFLHLIMKKISFLFVFSLAISHCWAQNLDSLFVVAQQTKNDSVKIRLYNKIGFSYIFNNTRKAKQVILEGKQLAKDADFHFGLTELTNTYGIYMDVLGKSDSAKYYFEKALKMSRENGFKNIETMCINNLGMFNWNNGNYNEALTYFFQSLKISDELGSEKSSEASLNNIGLIYQEMNLNEKALEYHKKALKVREKFNLQNEQIASFNNIGINLTALDSIDEAVKIYKKGIELAKEKNNLIDHRRLLDNLANAHKKNGDTNLALKTYLEVLNISTKFDANEKELLSTYNNLTALYNDVNKPKEALKYAEKGFNLIEKYPESELVATDLYLTVAESYYMLQDFEKARLFKNKFIAQKDYIFSDKNAKAIADLEIKYETEKKEREILIQRAELAESKLTIQQRNYQIYGLIGLTLILGFIGFLLYKQQKLKNRQLQKESELKDALIKIETQNKLQEQRLRISRDLHDNIGSQLTFIISSLDNLKYAFDINDKALNKKLNTISDFTSGTIRELRDTIWAMNKSEISFEDLQARISNYIDKAHLYDSNIKFEFKVEDEVNKSKKFTSVEGMNILRVIQEAIHNSLKYAEASSIVVTVDKVNSSTVFKISDDGKGFDLKTVKRGNGLNNMEKRALEINGDFDIESQQNQGTIVQIRL